MSRKHKNIIDVNNALVVFKSYSFQPIVFNDYQIRISLKDFEDVFFDWYHTSGTLVISTKNFNKGMGKFMDSESVAQVICKEIEKNELSF